MKFAINRDTIFRPAFWRRVFFAYLPSWLSIALLLALAHGFAKLTWAAWPAPQIEEKALAQRAAPLVQPNALPGTAASPAMAALSVAIASWHLFGMYQPQQAAVTAPVAVPETPLNLVLRGVVATDDAVNARAIIADPAGKQDYYAVNAQLPGGAVLKEIHADRIILARNNQNETLSLPKTPEAGGAPSTGAELSAATQVNPEFPEPVEADETETGTEVEPAPPVIETPPPDATEGSNDTSDVSATLRNYRDALKHNPKDLLGLGRVEPVNQGDRFLGYRLQPGNDATLFSQFGLQAGDVITSVNGVTLDNPAKGFQAIQALKTAGEVQVVVNRNGEQKTLDFQVDQ